MSLFAAESSPERFININCQAPVFVMSCGVAYVLSEKVIHTVRTLNYAQFLRTLASLQRTIRLFTETVKSHY